MSKSRAKGTRYENDLVAYFRANGFPDAHRLEFSSPFGDIVGLPIVVEAKDQKAMTLPVWLAQAEKSGFKVGRPFAVFHKRARKNISKHYVTAELDQFLIFMRSYQYCLDNHVDLTIPNP